MNHQVGQGRQRPRIRQPRSGQGGQGVVAQRLGMGLGALQPQQRDIRGLVVRGVFACGFAQCGCVLRHVQDVVHHLERQTQSRAIGRQPGQRRSVGLTAGGAHHHAALQQGPYAPLFNMEPMNQTVMHPFWVMSMFFFLVPLMLVCLFLFEILLSQWRIREATIATLSRIDPLTNVMNRRSIANQLEQLHQQRKALYSVVLLDLDHFKHINDNYGHDMGDQVLIQVAECLAQHVREQDMIGRFGGEEFILLLPNTTTEQAQHVAERCRIALTELNFVYEQQPFSISASFGISSSQNASEPQQIIRQADQALYAVKTAGRNQVQIYCK